VGIADCSPEDRQPSSEGGMSARLRVPASATLTLVGLKTVAHRNDRPGPDVPASVNAPSLDRLVKDARAAEKRIADLEQTRKRTATTLLFENLDQAQRIETAVERGQSVAAFARQAVIGERRAQRLYKLAARSDEIRQEVRADESRYGDDFVCPSWKQFLRPEPTEPEDNGTESAKKLSAQLARAQSRIAELEAHRLKSRYGMFGRGNPERETPKWLFDHYDSEFHLGLDVCATTENKKCVLFFTKAENGLRRKWLRNIWLNPPYSEIEPWCKKAWEYAQTGKGVVVALLPLWPTAPWFKKYVIHGHIRLLTTRVRFVGEKGNAPVDLMIVVWTATSQSKNGRLRVTLEDVPKPKK
jgi:phage N-6-adenine-methyltransferase